MKTLTSHINEHFALENEFVNEAFASERVSFVMNAIGKWAKKMLIGETGLLWSKLEDTDFWECTKENFSELSNKEIKNGGYIIVWLDSRNKFMGATRGTDAFIIESGWDESTKKYKNRLFKTVTGAKKIASMAYVIKDPMAFSAKPLRNERFASRDGATAFKTNSKILQENHRRWAAAIAEAAAAKFDTSDKFIAEMTDVIGRAQKTLIASMIAQDWKVVERLNYTISQAVRRFEDTVKYYAEYDQDVEEHGKAAADKWTLNYLKRSINDANGYIKALEAFNDAE